ncbi:hypothetical protein ACLOJK_008169 [Asimina triloba]
MASQMLVFPSSLAPKLAATFNSRTTAPLAPSPLRTTSNSSSSLPTPDFLHLKASSGVRALQTTSPFKCYAAITDGKPLTILMHACTCAGEPKEIIVGGWEDIPDVEHNEQVQALGQFAVDEENKKPEHAKSPIKFIRVVEAERQVVAGMNYRLWIEAEVDKVDKVFKALVFVGLPVVPKELKSFNPQRSLCRRALSGMALL